MVKIAPSLLSCDFSRLADEVNRVAEAGADLLHIDVMDGHFVPNITIGPVVVKHLRKITRLPLDTHLMIENPASYADAFIDAGSDMITMHIETIQPAAFLKEAERIKAKGIKVGVSLNPNTPISRIGEVLGAVDLVLVMSVNPGFGGQKFIPEALPKIRELRRVYTGEISVDGGVNDVTAASLRDAGATILVSGSYIFGAADARLAMDKIRS